MDFELADEIQTTPIYQDYKRKQITIFDPHNYCIYSKLLSYSRSVIH